MHLIAPLIAALGGVVQTITLITSAIMGIRGLIYAFRKVREAISGTPAR